MSGNASLKKVIWKEGMFIRPQHFQQQERYLMNEQYQKLLSTQRFYWGCQKLEVNSTDLQAGKFGLSAVSAVFQDGTVFNAPLRDSLPPPVSLPDGAHNAIVYLVLPPVNMHAVEVASKIEHDSPQRYVSVTHEVPDMTKAGNTYTSDHSRNERPLEMCELQCRLTYELDNGDIQSPDDAAFLKLPVARIKEVNGKRVTLDDKYIPSLLWCDQSNQLKTMMSKILNSVQARVTELSELTSGRVNENSRASTNEFMLLQTLNRYEPVLAQLNELNYKHPQALYEFLLGMAGELSTFMTNEKRAPDFVPYSHDDLTTCFDNISVFINQCFSAVLERKVVELKISPPKQGYRAIMVHNSTLFQEGQFIITVKANVPTDSLLSDFPRQIKIGPREDIQNLVNSHLPAIGLEHLIQVPNELRAVPDTVYFQLDKTDRLWPKLSQSAAIVLHIDDGFPELELRMLAITKK